MAATTTPTAVDTTDYGNDIDTFVDGVPDLSDDVPVEGPLVVAQGVARRWTARRGAIFYAPETCTDALSFVNHDPTPAELGRLEEALAKEARAVAGVFRASVTVTLGEDRRLLITGRLTTIGGSQMQITIDEAGSVLITSQG